MVLSFGGFLGRWLDRTFWCGWLVFCMCYVGTCPLVTTQLDSFITSRYCEHFPAGGMSSFWRTACREASAHTAAVLISLVFGAVSYSFLSGQIRWLCGGVLKLPRLLQLLLAGAIFSAV